MSGPKVIRIVTREEHIARCQAQLARLDVAITEWEATGQRFGGVSTGERQATQARRDTLRALLAQDRFLELQQGVDAEIAFLQSDRERRLAEAATTAARQRSNARRTRLLAASMLAAVERSGATLSPETRRELEAGADGAPADDTSLRRALEILTGVDAPNVTERQRELAEALRETHSTDALAALWNGPSAAAEDAALSRVEQRLAEVTTLIGADAAGPFERQLTELALEPDPARRRLVLDSLQIDLAAAVSAARARLELQHQLRLTAAALTTLEEPEAQSQAETMLAGVNGSTDDLARLLSEGQATLLHAQDAAAARSRRRAVLAGLSELGYQVTEELQTAWVRDGRVVVRRAAQPEYGVELGGGGEAARFQVRTVAFRDESTPPDAARDRDAEAISCTDVTALQERVASGGGEIVIERALPVGAAPLKVVSNGADEREHLYREPPRVHRERGLE